METLFFKPKGREYITKNLAFLADVDVVLFVLVIVVQIPWFHVER